MEQKQCGGCDLCDRINVEDKHCFSNVHADAWGVGRGDGAISLVIRTGDAKRKLVIDVVFGK